MWSHPYSEHKSEEKQDPGKEVSGRVSRLRSRGTCFPFKRRKLGRLLHLTREPTLGAHNLLALCFSCLLTGSGGIARPPGPQQIGGGRGRRSGAPRLVHGGTGGVFIPPLGGAPPTLVLGTRREGIKSGEGEISANDNLGV